MCMPELFTQQSLAGHICTGPARVHMLMHGICDAYACTASRRTFDVAEHHKILGYHQSTSTAHTEVLENLTE